MKITHLTTAILLSSLFTFGFNQEVKAQASSTIAFVKILQRISKNQVFITITKTSKSPIKERISKGVDIGRKGLDIVRNGSGFYMDCKERIVSHDNSLKIGNQDRLDLLNTTCRNLLKLESPINLKINPIYKPPSSLILVDKSKKQLPPINWSKIDWSKPESSKIVLSKPLPLKLKP